MTDNLLFSAEFAAKHLKRADAIGALILLASAALWIAAYYYSKAYAAAAFAIFLLWRCLREAGKDAAIAKAGILGGACGAIYYVTQEFGGTMVSWIKHL